MPAPARPLAKLLPHEDALAAAGVLKEVTHVRASARWFRADSADVRSLCMPGLATCREMAKQEDVAASDSDTSSWLDFIAASAPPPSAAVASLDSPETGANVSTAGPSSASSTALVAVYRPMADTEFGHLLRHGVLPATQPYHAIMPGPAGREYSEKYLNGKKRVDTCPSSVVEFIVPEALLGALMRRQHKAEDGCMSHGLGTKAGRTVEVFNSWLRFGRTALSCADASGGRHAGGDGGCAASHQNAPAVWRLVVVKRRPA